MAVLDLNGLDANEAVSVNVQVEGSDFILCNLNKATSQAHLDLIFSEGEKIKFYTTGKGNVHLTGYTIPDENLDMLDDEEFSDDDVSVDDLDLNNLKLKRKSTETMKLTGKDAKKLKANDGKAIEQAAKVQKVIDVDPKQLIQAKKENKPQDQQKNKQQQANQQQPKNKAQANKLAVKGLEESDEDDDLSIDEDDEESIDMMKMMDNDDSDEANDLEDSDLESDDDDEGLF